MIYLLILSLLFFIINFWLTGTMHWHLLATVTQLNTATNKDYLSREVISGLCTAFCLTLCHRVGT